MRHFSTWPEALNELKRELAEMGIVLQTKSVQNMDVSTNPDYQMRELQNYTYTVTNPTPASIPLKDATWCDAEFKERTSGIAMNPGNAWKLRREYWEQFLNREGKFDYAYPERIHLNLEAVVKALKQDINTRRAFLPIIDIAEDEPETFSRRFPCSIGYLFQFRQGRLNMTYLQRSSDFSEHFNNDVWLACQLGHWVAQRVGVQPGYFCHWLGSLHIFQKDIAGVF